MELKEIFGKRLEEAVTASRLSYAEVAAKVGISKATMSMYKHGKALPSLQTLSELCDVLEVSADYLLGKVDI